MKAINIKWDTDGDEELLYTLPKEMELPAGMVDEDEISDWLSDTEGFCHNGFEVIDEPDTDKTKKTFIIPVSYEVSGLIAVRAESVEAAVLYAEEHIDDLPLPSVHEYVDGSYEIEKDEDIINMFTKEHKKGNRIVPEYAN